MPTNPYLEYVTNTPNTAPATAGDTPSLATLFAPQHVFNFGPLSINCDLDPSDGVMGVTCSLMGFVFFEQKFSKSGDSVMADCARGPINVHLKLTPNFTNHSIAYEMKLCMVTACTNLAGTMGGYSAPAPVVA